MIDFRDAILFGQQKRGECSPGRITGGKIFHAAGIVVDRSSTPNHIYVADTGNNRVLGFRAYDSKRPERIFGQPDEFSGAPNHDCNLGVHAPATRDSLCLLNPANPNPGEQWMRVNLDVDAAGNLYVPDFHNNRVLIYRDPFDPSKVKGAGDNLPDVVLGQADFVSNEPNRGKGKSARDARSLYLSYGGFDHVSARGVSVDGEGNVWVADTFNYRVLRFPPGATQADLVLGQPDFSTAVATHDYHGHRYDATNAPLDGMCTPVLARLDPDTRELYVVDEYPGGFFARILVFTPPFHNGMAASSVIFPQQPLAGDYRFGYRFTHATSLVFNRFRSDEVIPATGRSYREGVFWVHDETRTLLLDGKGAILLAIGAPGITTKGRRFDTYGLAGMDPETPFNLIWPGGMIGFDSADNIYLGDEAFHRISRYQLPYVVRVPPIGPPKLPDSNGGLFGGTPPLFNNPSAANFLGPGIGAITHGGQLIVRDFKRYLVWDNYQKVQTDGPDATYVIGQPSGDVISQGNTIYGRSMHTIDKQGRMWACGDPGRLFVYQLPIVENDTKPLRERIPLYWENDRIGPEIQYRADNAVAFEPRSGKLWVYDRRHHRLLRVQIPEDLSDQFLVDCVIGQTDKDGALINRGMKNPDASSLGDVNDIRFDRYGNLFVVDNTYECHDNQRVIVFLADDLESMSGMFPSIRAQCVFVAPNFEAHHRCGDLPQYIDLPYSPVSIAFNSRNEMVLGNDGYYTDPKLRHLRQLYLYRNPLEKQTPDAVIEFPVGTPGELSFDDDDNLILQDHTWSKVWVLNLEREPGMVKNLD